MQKKSILEKSGNPFAYLSFPNKNMETKNTNNTVPLTIEAAKESNMLMIGNEGGQIKSTNYWASTMNDRGYFVISVNAGTIRILLPTTFNSALADMKTAREVIITRGVLRPEGKECMEMLFEDNSSNPYVLYTEIKQWLMVPSSASYRAGWKLTVWREVDGKPACVLERPCRLRNGSLPCLKPWKS